MGKITRHRVDLPAQSKAGQDGRDEKGKRKTKESVATVLAQIVNKAGVWLFRTSDSVAYAVVPTDGYAKTMKLDSTNFSSWLKRTYFLATSGKVVGTQAVKDAVGSLEGFALHNSPLESVHLRTAEKDGKLYIDLGDDRWRAVEIDAEGWRIVDKPPVRFRRSKAMRALPEPKRDGSLDWLHPFLNVASEEDWRLAVAWVLAALRPVGPYPLLVLSGQQGSAKSTTARVLRRMVDPNAALIRCEPKEVRDLMITANDSWVLALDNLSSIPVWLSDALCRLSTGGGFATRQLYSNDEEMIFDAQRPVILTSIEDITTRGDLLDRSLILSLPPIPESERRPEKDFWDQFDAKYPFILGALLDALSGALRELPEVKLARIPRMADFAVWATACERALGWPAGSFLAAYNRNRADANAITLDSSPLSSPLRQLLANTSEWSGAAAELLKSLEKLVPDTARGREWPRSANVLSNKLRRLAPNLALAGITVEFRRDTRTRTVILRREKFPETPSSPSSPSPERENQAFSDDDPQAGHRHRGAKDRHSDDGDDASDDPLTIPTPQKPLKNKASDDGDDGDDLFGNFSSDTTPGAKTVWGTPKDELEEAPF